MKKRRLLLSSASLLPLLGAAQAERPNIIIMNIDDMGYSDPSCFGGDYVNTTNIDQLANEGLSLTQFYTACPISSPSRVGLTTGMYPTRWGINTFLQERVNNAKNEQNDFLSDKAPSMARALKNSGYATGHFGKWHMGGGRDVKNAPSILNYGFDEYVSTWESPDPDPKITSTNWIWAASDEIKRWDRTAYFIDKTLDFLSRHKNEPCFVSLWPDDVHTPWVYDGDEASQRESAGSFSIVLAELDRQIGRFMQGLKDLGIDENTIVIFTGDNGPAPAFDGHRTNDFRGQKGTLYEGGIRMPFIIRWPQHIPAGVKNDESVVCMVDLFPSLCAIAGAEVPTDYPLDGLDMSDVIMGQSSRERATPLFWEFGKCKADRVSPHIAVREGEWKLLVNADGSRTELYNMTTDFNEQHNVASSNPALTERLKEAAIDWFNEAYREYADNIIYVTPDGDEGADGISWEKATNLNHALTLAQSVSGTQIWMKQGTYNVTSSVNCDNIAFYGGFNGTEKKLMERNWKDNPTIVDGGGAVSPFRNSLTTTVSTILDGLIVQNGLNQADANGNGNGGGAILNSGAMVRNCIFRNNRTQNGKNGAAIHCHTGQLRIENCLFVNNSSSGNGGAIQVGGGVTATVVNCTLVNNQATGPGGAFGLGANTSNLNVYNTIAWHNTGRSTYNSYGQNADINGGGTVVSKYSAIESTSTKFTDGDDTNHLFFTEDVTPMFCEDGYELTDGSPCIDAGNVSLTSGLDFDLGMQRRLSGAQIDMGAYEFDNGEPTVGNSVIHVSPDGNAEADGTSWEKATNLSHALSLADSYIDKATLWLKEGTYLITSPIHPDKMEIYGGFEGSEQNLEERNYAVHQTIIDGEGTISPFRNSNLDGNVVTVLDGLIVQNGINQAGANGNGNGGGAILTNGATVRNCIFRNNRTQNGKNGAAIHCHLGQVSIENSLFTGNTSSGNGGAIQVGGGTTATVINCTLCDNTASGPGGAFGLGTNGSNLNVYNSIAWHNVGSGSYNSYGQNTDVNGGGTVIALSSAIESQSTKFTDGNDENHIFLSQENTPLFAEGGYQLQEGSPCIDTGDDNYAAISLYDLAYGKRVSGIHIDRGAYEYIEDDANAIKQTGDRRSAIYNIYNVAGQRINHTRKGINIVNGEKIIKR
jgi:arylsulfatase A-like enzyme